MLFIKELKKICCSFVYVLFIGLLLLSWHENFCGVTQKGLSVSKGNNSSVYTEISGGFILEEPDVNAKSYGIKNEEVPEKIMCGGADVLIMEYLKNSYATYPFTYYKEVVLSDKEQEEILAIICEITGLTEEQIVNLPDDYFPRVNGNIIHFGDDAQQTESGSYTFKAGESSAANCTDDYTQHFVSQVSYDRFKELMAKAEDIIGSGSNYAMENLIQYYGLAEMTYDEAMEEYNKTIYVDKVSNAFARLFCDYISRSLGLYPVFVTVIFWLKDRRNHMNELIDCRQIPTAKLVVIRFLAMLTAIMLPVILLSFESLAPLMKYSADTGVAIDTLAFLKHIVWWLLPTAMAVTSLGMFLTILTSAPIAVLVQFVWWFVDSSFTGLSGDTGIFTLMIRHNILGGSEVIDQDLAVICLNRGLFVTISLLLAGLSILIYNKQRGGKFNYEYIIQKHFGVFKERLLSRFQR